MLQSAHQFGCNRRSGNGVIASRSDDRAPAARDAPRNRRVGLHDSPKERRRKIVASDGRYKRGVREMTYLHCDCCRSKIVQIMDIASRLREVGDIKLLCKPCGESKSLVIVDDKEIEEC